MLLNLAARLQSHAELGGILVAHETSCLIKDTILTEEQEAISVLTQGRPGQRFRGGRRRACPVEGLIGIVKL